MDTNEHKLIYKKEVFEIVGSALEVLNELGQGVILNFKRPKLEWIPLRVVNSLELSRNLRLENYIAAQKRGISIMISRKEL